MQIIDFHTHIYPEPIAKKATKSICDFYDLETELIGRKEELLQRGRQAGITRFVLLPVAIKPEQVHHINEFICKEIQNQREFYGFGTLHAALEDYEEEIDYIEASGLKGIKLHPDTQQFPIDDERLFPMYDKLQGRLPVLLHCGDKRYDYSHPRRLLGVLHTFPKLQVIAAHLGGWSLYQEAYHLLKDTRCYFDISSCFGFLSPQQIAEYIEGYGADKILFGSDFPIGDPVKEVEAFLNLDIKEADKEKIAYQNASALLGIE